MVTISQVDVTSDCKKKNRAIVHASLKDDHATQRHCYYSTEKLIKIMAR